MEKEIVWKDITSYSRDELFEERKPRVWHLDLAPQLSVAVMSNHLHNPGIWTMNFRPWLDVYPLDIDTERYSADEAKAVALFHVRRILKYVNDEIAGVLGSHNETTVADLIQPTGKKATGPVTDWKPGETKRAVGGVIIYKSNEGKCDD
ncbi:MAG: hypothetical protein NXH70_02065 [Hyphomonas sp.]|nr:hypothetical protein [Hyphomonas sp.]